MSSGSAAAFGGGKVILLGEHSVVYGHPALAAGLTRGVTAVAEPSTEDRLVVSPWDVDVRGPELLEASGAGFGNRSEARGEASLARAFAAALEGYLDRPAPVCIRAEVDLPGGAGLGCSAAIGVAVVGALDAHYGVERTNEERGAYSMRWERVFHGNPSGVDNAMSACGGVAVFKRGEPLRPVKVQQPFALVVAHSGESSSTKEIVDHVARQHDKEPERMQQIFEGIGVLVNNARLAVEADDLRALGQLMDMNQALLSAMMISTEKLETLCRVARAGGALGAKLTGAGGGGCMIALCASLEEARALEPKLAEHASMTLVAEVGSRADARATEHEKNTP